MYAELASTYGARGGYLDKAIDNYKEAITADPDSPVLTEELSELYIGSGRLREAQTDAEEALKKNPNDLAAHRLLARVFTSQIGDQQRNRIDESMVKKAIEQYQKISELDPEGRRHAGDAGPACRKWRRIRSKRRRPTRKRWPSIRITKTR